MLGEKFINIFVTVKMFDIFKIIVTILKLINTKYKLKWE